MCARWGGGVQNAVIFVPFGTALRVIRRTRYILYVFMFTVYNEQLAQENGEPPRHGIVVAAE